MNKFHKMLICFMVSICLILTGCGADANADETNKGEPSISSEEGCVENGEPVQDAIIGEWKLVDLVQIENGSEHIVAKTLASKKSGNADYFALGSWFVIKVYNENILECTSSSVIIKPYIENYGSGGSWEKMEEGSYKIFADGLLNSGAVARPKLGYMVGIINDGILTCTGESEDEVSFIATLRYAGEV